MLTRQEERLFWKVCSNKHTGSKVGCNLVLLGKYCMVNLASAEEVAEVCVFFSCY